MLILRSILPILILTLATATAAATPERLVADELAPGKVVMLGDTSHGAFTPLAGLLSVIECWAEDLAAGRPAPRKLCLAMELDSELGEAVERALVTGDTDDMLNLSLPFTHLGNHEFLTRLHRLRGGLTCGPGEEEPSLSVIGLEASNIFDIASMTPDESFRFYVEERDQLSAATMLAHLAAEPDAAVLCYYGSLHLVLNETDKWTRSMPVYPGDSWGRFLGGLLKDELGAERLLSVTQIRWSPDLEFSGLAVGDEDVLVPWTSIVKESLPPPLRDHEYDRAIVRHGAPGERHPVKLICSRRVVDAAIAALERYPPSLGADTFLDQKLKAFRPALATTTGMKFAGGAEWRRWFDAADYDGQAWLDSEGFKDEVRTLMGIADTGDRQAFATLTGLGVPAQFMTTRMAGRALPLDMVWDDIKPSIDVVQAAGTWWCGDAGERERAQARLTSLTGGAFDSPADAMAWWREHYGFRVDGP